MTKLSFGQAPLAPWVVKKLLREHGFGADLDAGVVQVQPGGHVTVNQAGGGSAFSQSLFTHADLEAFFKAVGGRTGRPLPQNPDGSLQMNNVQETLIRTRAAAFENRVNNRVWMGQTIAPGIEKKYMGGERFDVPMKRLPKTKSALIAAEHPFTQSTVEAIQKFFVDAKGGLFVPVHPQEVPFRSMPTRTTDGASAPKTLEGVRCASSERTVHAAIPGAPDVLFKLDLANIVHFQVTRPVDAGAGEFSVEMTRFLLEWTDANVKAPEAGKKPDPFCFLPEVATLIDKADDAAVVVRMTTPYPPLSKDGPPTWTMPMFSLVAKDPDFPNEPPTLVRLLRDRPDKTQGELDWFAEKIIEPMIEGALRVHVDLGSSMQAHGQNSSLELGRDGQPTGRIVFSDLEAFWPHPDLAAHLKRADFYEEHGYEHDGEAKEAKVSRTFEFYFWEQNMNNVLQCFDQHFPHLAAASRQRVANILKGACEKRRDVILGAPPGVYETFRKHIT